MTKRMLLLVSILIISSTIIYAAATDYLILQDISPYKLFTTVFPEDFKGPLPKYSQTATGGVLTAAGHFSEGDLSYEASYTEPSSKWPFVEVEVTLHSGSDSDKWLLHEMDSDFRNYYGMPTESYSPSKIDGQTIFNDSVSGETYRWISGNKVVEIKYRDMEMTKPEPLEVVKAYLSKHPSTIPAMTLSQLRSTENKTKWIKDEMDRRLWLGDKWAAQIQPTDQKLRDKLKSMTDSMVVFLNYREKYYGISAKDGKIALETALFQNNVAAVQAKLTEYKTWWTAHKGDSITL